ncbi:hypothetical protein [Chitinimonas lacunae]|uniref:Uncharacterized protein n=1 Tax=Chitinimonas lacunae TaxID=1963018 RepID=A0ABV8MML0_9NEIS
MMRPIRTFCTATARHLCLMLTALVLVAPAVAVPQDGIVDSQGLLAEPVTVLPSTAAVPDAPLPGDTAAAAEPIAAVKRPQARGSKSPRVRREARTSKRGRAMAGKAAARGSKAKAVKGGKSSSKASRKGGKRR